MQSVNKWVNGWQNGAQRRMETQTTPQQALHHNIDTYSIWNAHLISTSHPLGYLVFCVHLKALSQHFDYLFTIDDLPFLMLMHNKNNNSPHPAIEWCKLIHTFVYAVNRAFMRLLSFCEENRQRFWCFSFVCTTSLINVTILTCKLILFCLPLARPFQAIHIFCVIVSVKPANTCLTH